LSFEPNGLIEFLLTFLKSCLGLSGESLHAFSDPCEELLFSVKNCC
jgi:hypothetical protein